MYAQVCTKRSLTKKIEKVSGQKSLSHCCAGMHCASVSSNVDSTSIALGIFHERVGFVKN